MKTACMALGICIIGAGALWGLFDSVVLRKPQKR